MSSGSTDTSTDYNGDNNGTNDPKNSGMLEESDVFSGSTSGPNSEENKKAKRDAEARKNSSISTDDERDIMLRDIKTLKGEIANLKVSVLENCRKIKSLEMENKKLIELHVQTSGPNPRSVSSQQAEPNLIDKIEADVNLMKRYIDETARSVVLNNQYSRRTHIRVNGIKYKNDDENCAANVCSVLREKLKLSVEELSEQDIEIAHRIRQNQSRGGDEGEPRPPPSILVRFKYREKRDHLLKVRRQLKGSGINIQEDLAKELVQLRNRGINSKLYSNVFASHGKIFGISLIDGRKKRLQLYEPLPQ